jgi:muconolactone delta-isomerase
MMEYLVTMTTRVPDGTPTEAVDDMRRREADRARQLAAAGNLLRLWRPPLQPGEWRTLGLFSAANAAALEDVLSSMPLRVWRTDTVVDLARHANDPGEAARNHISATKAPEFLTTFDVPPDIAQHVRDGEARRSRQLADEGHLLRLWILPPPPSGSRALGLWRARDADEMQTILESLPMIDRMLVETTPLSQHPSDPALDHLTQTE